MNELPDMPVVEREVKTKQYGGQYVSKMVFEDAYYRITVHFNEYGFEVKRDSKKLD